MRRVVDPIFAEPRLAEVYDPLDPDRSDLDAYVAVVEEFGARSVLDIGCGTGTFACLLARRGCSVTAVDPAGASLAVARAKPGAERVRWVHGYATDLPPLQVDLVTMTANVAQVFLTDAAWDSTLQAAYAALRPGGRLVFETRDPAARAWLEWNREHSHQRTVVPGVGGVQAWHELLEVSGDLVSFRTTVSTDQTLADIRRSGLEHIFRKLPPIQVCDARHADGLPPIYTAKPCARREPTE